MRSNKFAFHACLPLQFRKYQTSVYNSVQDKFPSIAHSRSNGRCSILLARTPSMQSRTVKGSRPKTPAEHGLQLDRQNVMTKTRNGRVMRIRRWATLEEIDITEYGNGDQRVDVWVVINQVRGGVRVRGRVVSSVIRNCDRCTAEFPQESDGRFELLLKDDELDNVAHPEERLRPDMANLEEVQNEIDMQMEEVAEFGKSVTTIELNSHVRDAVYLGIPSKALCKNDCSGVNSQDNSGLGSVTYEFNKVEKDTLQVTDTNGEFEDEQLLDDNKKSGTKNLLEGNEIAAQKLMALKKKLEEQGK